MKKQSLQYIALVALLAWSLVAQFTSSAYRTYIQVTAGQHVLPPFIRAEFSAKIERLPPRYRASDLRIGDEIMALNGKTIESAQQFEGSLLPMKPGQTLAVTVKRMEDGRAKTMVIPVQMQGDSSQAIGWTLLIALHVILPFSCLLVGFYVAFARPLDPLAWITMVMLASFGQLAGGDTSWAISPPWRELWQVYHEILSNTWPLWLVLFALYFPVPFRFLAKHRWTPWLLASPMAVLAALELYGDFEERVHLDRLAALASFEHANQKAIILLFTAYVFAFFLLLARKRNAIHDNDSRRRLRLMITGCSLSLTPLFLVTCSRLGFLPRLAPWVITLCLSMLVVFPFTMAYVIVVQRAMDVRMVVRSGVQYAVASGGIKVLRVALVVVVVLLTLRLAQQSDHRAGGLLAAAVGLALIITVGRLARRVSKWMDRRFFREAYDAEQILTELSGSVAGIRDTKALLETVATRIASSLHVPRIAVLLERGGLYQPAYALGFGSPELHVEFRRDTATMGLLAHQQTPARVYFDDPASWVHAAPEQEQNALQTLDSQVLLPLTLKSRLLGMISLGSKRSELPYTSADLRLLGAVASQTGLALENAQLTETIRKEVAQRERQERELEIALEVQQRLFPQKLPHVDGLDFAGYCRPALGVGGDYYDFIRVPDGCLGIAIGDVSGKGIAAALMMANLQASLRGQTIKPAESISEMIQLINRLVYEASADHRYATFFYAQYDPAKRLLRYVNAGHNAPIVYRQEDGEAQFLRLEEGGTVIGLFPGAQYRESQLDLEPGDILVAFTDGISEAMNSAEEEFDEPRLFETLRACDKRSAADIITYILENVDRFTAGAVQHDDMTVVVARLQ
jgi:sigma-B regulation protein RsbU (phosphoserine phosphatase)